MPVKFVAVDRQGKSAIMELQLTMDSAVPAGGRPLQSRPKVDFGTYHALIIGNNIYTHFPSLTTPDQDAHAVAAVLSKQYGFKTKVLLNATRCDILQALNDFRKTLTDKDNLLIYYAGHGHSAMLKMSVEDLARQADTIILGTVTPQESAWDAQHTADPYGCHGSCRARVGRQARG